MEKKAWQTPNLVILGRGKAEERVLAQCKTGANPGGPADNDAGCYITGTFCGECSSFDAS